MADITLAEFDGSVWLVGGEAYLGDLLINALPPGLSIELVPCERKSDVHALWHRLCVVPAFAVDPWIIHPNIARRFRAPPALAVVFAPWIVMPDEDGMRAIGAAAESAADPGVTIVLAAHAEAEPGPAAAELLSLRLRMIEEALERAAVPKARILREQRDCASPDAQPAGGGRVDLEIRPLAAA